MATYQRILVPIDGSTTSGRALQEAIRLSDVKTRLRLIYVLEEVFPLDSEGYAFIDYPTLQEAVRLTGQRALTKARERVQGAGMAPEAALLEAKGDSIAKVIGDEAQRWGADLIVIGTHGRSGLNRLLLGSVAEGVVRGASVPVLLVRAG